MEVGSCAVASMNEKIKKYISNFDVTHQCFYGKFGHEIQDDVCNEVRCSHS